MMTHTHPRLATFAAVLCLAAGSFADTVKLGKVTGNKVVKDGSVITGTLSGDYRISIAEGATVTLKNVDINKGLNLYKDCAGLTCKGDATIILEGENYIRALGGDNAGIFVPPDHTLTIKGFGNLTVWGRGLAAGIGGGYMKDCGNIVIAGGWIEAWGGQSEDGETEYGSGVVIVHPGGSYGGPGIGSGQGATCGTITFERGNVISWGSGLSQPAIGGYEPDLCEGVVFEQTIGRVRAVVGEGLPDSYLVHAKSVDYGVVDGLSDGYAGTNTKKVDDGYPGGKESALDWNSHRTLTVASQLGGFRNKTISDEHVQGKYVEWRRSCLRGEVSGDYKITIDKGAEIVFDGVTVAGGLRSDIPGITCMGDAIIILKGENYIKGHGEYSPGIFVPEGATLSIQGDGSLTVVSGGKSAAAIGGFGWGASSIKPCGKIRILSGEITAIGGESASALGGFFKEDGSTRVFGDDVMIYGGSLRARGGVPLADQEKTFISDGVKVTSDGDEEFFRWNGRLDKVPDAIIDDAGDEVYIVAHDDITITGNFPSPKRIDYFGFVYDREIRIADGARVTLKDAVIMRPECGVERSMEEGAVFSRHKKDAVDWPDYSMMATTPRYHSGIRCMGDAKIKIKGDNLIEATDSRAGISVANGKKLTLKGNGTLTLQGGRGGDGIEGGSNVVIEGGVINAYGGDGGRGIVGKRIEFVGGSTTAIAYKTGASAELAGFHAFSNSDNSEIVIGSSLKRETEEVSGFNGSGYFKNCTEKISFNGNLDGLGDDDEESGGAKGAKKTMKLASALPKLLGAGETDLDLSGTEEPDSEAIAGSNTVITGTLHGRHKIAIAPDATVTLRDATIWPTSSSMDSPYAGLTCLGNATIILEGTNCVGSFNEYFPGISVPSGYTLTIGGTGSLEAVGGTSGGAGIGGVREQLSGSIVVAGGDVTATGGYGAAGIGGAYMGNCSTVSIEGGIVNATGGANAPGIGVGYNGAGYAVYVRSGIAKVVATKGEGAPAYIGTGEGGSLRHIDISVCLNYTDSGNTRTYSWNGNLSLAGSESSDTLEFTALDGKTITGTISDSNKKVKVKIWPGAHVTLNNAMINKTTAKSDDTPWAGITCLGDATITLMNTNEVSSFYADYPGIYVPQGCTLTIEGKGTLTANNYGASGGAGIGGGSAADCLDCGEIVINGGDIECYGGDTASGIGFGYNGWCDGVQINPGIVKVQAQRGENCPYEIGFGSYGSTLGGYFHIAKGVIETTPSGGISYYRQFEPDPNTDLSELTGTGEKVIASGAIVTGTLGADRKISLAADAEVTLNNVVIPGNNDSSCAWAGINCLGDATIWLEGTNIVRGSYRCPGIHVPSGYTLTIKSKNENGELNAYAFDYAAGIGGGWALSCGNIVIEGGTIYAEGGAQCAGIGAGTSSASCGNITINGGVVTAKGGSGGCGIGAGTGHSSCGDVTINYGITYVEAIRGDNTAVPIGAANQYSSCGTITVVSGLSDTTLDGGSRRVIFPNVALGSLAGGEEAVVARDNATISGTLGANRQIVIAAGATVTLDNATINGVNNSGYPWAGITCLGDATIILVGENTVKGFYEEYPGIYVPRYKTLTIKGDGSLDASSNGRGAGIGGGGNISCGNIVIEGGVINANGGTYCAGIGGGDHADCGTVTIRGGTVRATGGDRANGIGGGREARCAGVSVEKGVGFVSATCVITAQSAGLGTVPVGTSMDNASGVTVQGGLCDETEENLDGAGIGTITRTIYPLNLDLSTLPESVTAITVRDGATLSGTLGHACKISIAAGAHVTLKQATILGVNAYPDYQWAGLTCLGDATITLRNASTVRGFYEDYPGIYVPEGCTLTINGTGSLTASSNGWGAGIGAGGYTACGNIVIDGGHVTARGGTYCAGIGGGTYPCGDITINGGTIYAYGGNQAAALAAATRHRVVRSRLAPASLL